MPKIPEVPKNRSIFCNHLCGVIKILAQHLKTGFPKEYFLYIDKKQYNKKMDKAI